MPILITLLLLALLAATLVVLALVGLGKLIVTNLTIVGLVVVVGALLWGVTIVGRYAQFRWAHSAVGREYYSFKLRDKIRAAQASGKPLLFSEVQQQIAADPLRYEDSLKDAFLK